MFTRQQSRLWDPSTIAISSNAKALVDEAAEAQIQARAERMARIGKKARRNRGDKAIKEGRTVEALVLDTLAHHLCSLPEHLVIKLGSDWLSAGPPELVARNRTVNERLEDLEEAGWLRRNKSARLNGHLVTMLHAGDQLLEAAKRLRVTLSDIGLEPSPPEIELRGRKSGGVNGRRPIIHFEKTHQTNAIEHRLIALNERLSDADLSATRLGPATIDLRRRRVSRAFLDGSFERGGRLNGPAFWLSLRKEIRREALRIDGEPIAEVDLQAAMPSIAYALEGNCPIGDPYSIPEVNDIPRDAIKIALMQMLWRPVRKGTPLADEARSMIPKAYVASQVFDLIKQRNYPIAHRLGAGSPCGAELMWHESEIIIEATLRCFEAGISALPLHDALLVSWRRAEEVQSILSAAFAERLGVQPTIKIKSFARQTSGATANA